MRPSNRLLAATFTVATLAAACKGPTGPQGAQGTTGPTGPQGPAGVANVQYSPWFTPATWTKDTIFGIFQFNAVHVDSAISQAVLDSGVVLVYSKLDGYNTTLWPTEQVGALPIVLTYMQSTVTYTDTWSAYLAIDSLRLNFVDNQNFYNSISNLHQFRYVIVPGGVALSASSERIGSRAVAGSRYTRAQLRAMSYEQITRLFHIPLD